MATLPLLEFVNQVPHPLTFVLVQLSPILSFLANTARIISWRQSWHDSFILLAAWWAICLFSEYLIRYFFPIICLAVFLFIRSRPARTTPTPTTDLSLNAAISDLLTIQTLLPSLPILPTLSFKSLSRVLILSYIPYLLLVYFIPLRVLLAISGSFFLIFRSPFIILLLSTLQRSAWFRFFLAHLTSFLTGQPLPLIPQSHQPLPTSPTPVPSLRFLFTIYENQRWWMGLDWSAALLPAERPSWSSGSHQPLSPPTSFTLPEPTSVFLPNPSGPGRIKRTATWTWEEHEWSVLVRNDPAGAPTRVEKPLPSPKDDSRLVKVAGKIRDSVDMDPPSPDSTTDSHEDENALTTDPDGWVYGDNKWEGLGSKGGMGKYTRHRRWTRVAIVSETVEIVGEGEIGIERSQTQSLHHTDAPSPSYYAPNHDTTSPRAVDSVTVNGVTTVKSAEEESPLRQRLRRALSKPSTPAP